MKCHTLILTLSLVAAHAEAEELSFPNIWRQVEQGSAAQESARLTREAAEEGFARAGRHWLPRLYLDAKAYGSNDPAANFMGLLEQRSVQSPDFSPSALNHPDARLYSRAALGLDLPIFQGGAGPAMKSVAKAEVDAKSEEAQQVRLNQYAEVGRAYGSLAALGAGTANLREMQAEVSRWQKGYRLASKANPVGRSGALGMQAVANKLAGLIEQYVALGEAQRAELRDLGVSSAHWSPEPVSAADFADQYLSLAAPQRGSHRVEALKAQAEKSAGAVNLERSKGLPQLGLFAEGYGFHGDRSTATGYSAGLYLRWNLFNPADFGSAHEARLRAAGAERFAEASAQEESAGREGLEASLRALRANLGLLAETEKILREQASVTETLFQNGSINALQFVEVVNRRADLAVQRLEAELAYLKAAAQALAKRKADLANGAEG